MNEETVQKFVVIIGSDENVEFEALRPLAQEILEALGCEIASIVLGEKKGYYRDIDGSAVDSFVANPNSGIVVMERSSNSDWATCWLEQIWQKTRGMLRTKKPIDEVASYLLQEIDRCTRLVPIQLTEHGERLRECPPADVLGDHTRDDHNLKHAPGIHDYCSSWFDVVQVSKTHNALHCKGCGLRVVFPSTITTYGELRRYFEVRLSEVP